jgi:hypothetical protein
MPVKQRMAPITAKVLLLLLRTSTAHDSPPQEIMTFRGRSYANAGQAGPKYSIQYMSFLIDGCIQVVRVLKSQVNLLIFGAQISVQRHAVGNGHLSSYCRNGHLCSHAFIAMRLTQSGARVIQL